MTIQERTIADLPVGQTSAALGAPQAGRVSEHSYVDWAAVLGGAVLATAISFVLFTFGAALGLSLTSPFSGEGISIVAFAVAAGIWVLWVQVLSFMAGGYVAGRMRRRAHDCSEHEVDVRDGVHGLLVWATGALAGAVLAAATLGGGADIAARTAPVDTAAAISETLTEATGALAAGEGDAPIGTAVAAELTAAEEARADAARRAGIIAAFVAAASLIVSAAAAFFTAGVGGRHRDQGLVIPYLTSRHW